MGTAVDREGAAVFCGMGRRLAVPFFSVAFDGYAFANSDYCGQNDWNDYIFW